MGSGLSMTSVNKIKELAAAREYSLALEIIDSQDLSKSLNPQFLRICGDVYIANERYVDARRILLMAHKMAPEAKRVMYSLVDLYLRMGYKDLAEFYYKLYVFDAEPNLSQTDHINYIYNKAQGCPLEEIETLLFPVYCDEMDYDWSFELYLLMKLQGKDAEATAIKNDYIASYKNEPNALLMEEIEQSADRLEELFYIYPKEVVADNDPEQEELRQVEKPLLEADDMRINPREAEIQILFDDNDKVSLGAKLKLKRYLKEQEKLAKKAEMDGDESPDEEQTSVEDASEDISQQEQPSDEENVAVENSDSDEQQSGETKISIFKKLFSRKKNVGAVDTESEETDNEIKTEEQEEQESEVEDEEAETETEADVEAEETETEAVVETEVSDAKVDAEVEESNTEVDIEAEEIETETDIEVDEIDVETAEETEVEADVEIEEAEIEETLGDSQVEVATEDDSEQEITEDMGDSVMQEIYEKKKISIVTEMGEDTFVNVQDVDTGNPFDDMIKNDNKSPEEPSEEVKSSFVFEEAQLEPEDDEQYDVDDFTGDFDVSDFDEEVITEEIVEETTETVEEETVEEIADTVEEEVTEEILEAVKEETVEEITEAVEEEAVEEITEAVEEEIVDEITETIEEEMVEELSEAIEEEVVEEITEPLDEETAEEIENKFSYATLEKESVYNTLKEKGNMDYPEFKTTLFPEYGKEINSVENNFNEIMSEAQDKINENLLKEEQMQREAEALLASLGIDLGSIKPTINSENTKLGYESSMESSNAPISQMVEEPAAVTPEKVEKQISEEIPEAVNDFRPSRDELKASLKIDSVKKNILKQIKEYR